MIFSIFKERGNFLLKFADKYLGIPLLFLLSLFKFKKSKPKRINSIALLKTAGIGDTIILSGVISDIKNKYPSSKIVLFVANNNFEIAKMIYGIEIVKLDLKNLIKSIKIIKKYKFDVWIDFGSWPRINAFFTYFGNAIYKIGFKTKHQYRHYIYDEYVIHNSMVHELENYRELAKKIDVPPISMPDFTFLCKNKMKENSLIIHMFPGGTKSYFKKWPEENWIKLINSLKVKFEVIYLTGSKEDFKDAQKFEKFFDKKVKIVAGKLNLLELICLICRSQMVISVNTGIMHLAASLNSNLIAIHGPTSSLRWGPLSDNAVSVNSKLKCAPCLNLGFEYKCKNPKCMESISVDEILNIVKFKLP